MMEYVNYTYTTINNENPKLDWVVDYPSTKISFRLDHIFFHKSTRHWKMGKTLSPKDGHLLNEAADSIYPAGKRNFKIHYTGAQARAAGYSVFPTTNMETEHYIVSCNGKRESEIEGRAWPMSIHIVHELAHNLDLYHTYSSGFDACNQNNPDYLDDVFGRGNEARCPHKGGWDCDYKSEDSPCTNNIMGGTKAGRYFSPKQVQRMHRALSLKSIGKYAIPSQFYKRNHIEVKKNETWDFSMKLYDNLIIRSGATLIVKDTLKFVPKASIYIEEGGKLIVDGGCLTHERYFKSTWGGVQIQLGKKSEKNQSDFIQLANGGQLRYNRE